VAVLNLMGRTFMGDVDCPFRAADRLLAEVPDAVRVRLVDMHAEATSEKKALAYHLDGRVSAVLGTHTHVQTNDPHVLPAGTGYLTDAGMCGVSTGSILGMAPEPIVGRFLSGMPTRFTLAAGRGVLQGALVEVHDEMGITTGIRIF
jgi:calcineurin-like phosphoesterase